VITALWVALCAAPITTALIIGRTCPDPDDQETDWWADLEHDIATRTGHVEIPPAEMCGGNR
jgi:hypothetical protein